MSTVPLSNVVGFFNTKFGNVTKSHIAPSGKDRVFGAMRTIVQEGGVSCLLAELKEFVCKRHPEDQARIWKMLLGVAEEAIHSLYARPGDSLLVWSNTHPWADMAEPYEPMITAQVTSTPTTFIEWYADPARNVSGGWERDWEREVRDESAKRFCKD